MPIIGLSDRDMKFPEIGQIRKGAPKTDKGYVGKDLTYFRVEFDVREKEAENLFKEHYPVEPREINILLPFDDIDRVWDCWLEAYTAGRMVARSDGERFLFLVDTETNEIIIRDGEPFRKFIKEEPVGYYEDNKGKQVPIFCDPVGRLKVVIPELKRMVYLTVMTSSIYDIANISAQLRAIKAVNSGKISGIPMVLKRRPKMVAVTKADGVRGRFEKWLLSIEADPEWVNAKIFELKRSSIPDIELIAGPGDNQIQGDVIEDDMEEVSDGEFKDLNQKHPDIEDEISQEKEPLAKKEKEEPKKKKIPPRPWDPDRVKKALEIKSEVYTEKGDEPIIDDDYKILEKAFLSIVGDNQTGNNAKLMILLFLTNQKEIPSLSYGYIRALMDWLIEKDDNGKIILDENKNPVIPKDSKNELINVAKKLGVF